MKLSLGIQEKTPLIFKSHYSSSSGNLYTLKSGKHTLLIEAGVPIKKIMAALDYKLSSVDGCLVSHMHSDHSMAIREVMAHGVDCYTTVETFGAVRAHGHRTHAIEPLVQFIIADHWEAVAFPTQHDCAGSVGFLISNMTDERFLFATDTFYLRHTFPGCTVIAVECNYSVETLAPDLDPVRRKRLLTSHFSLENVVKFFQANDLGKLREVHLLHLSDANSDAELFRKTIAAVTACPVYIAEK